MVCNRYPNPGQNQIRHFKQKIPNKSPGPYGIPMITMKKISIEQPEIVMRVFKSPTAQVLRNLEEGEIVADAQIQNIPVKRAKIPAAKPLGRVGESKPIRFPKEHGYLRCTPLGYKHGQRRNSKTLHIKGNLCPSHSRPKERF